MLRWLFYRVLVAERSEVTVSLMFQFESMLDSLGFAVKKSQLLTIIVTDTCDSAVNV